MSWIDLTNQGLLDAQFPYPLAFETCYNLALDFYNALSWLSNLLLVLVIIMVLVLITRIFWVIIR